MLNLEFNKIQNSYRKMYAEEVDQELVRIGLDFERQREALRTKHEADIKALQKKHQEAVNAYKLKKIDQKGK